MQILLSGDTVITAKLDRMFRSALDALTVIQDFQQRSIHLYLLDIGGDDVSGNGVSRMILQLLSIFAEFERSRIRERVPRREVAPARRTAPPGGGPFDWRVAPREEGDKRAPKLITLPAEQEAITEIQRLRGSGTTLRAIAGAMKDHGFRLSPETVRQVLERTTESGA
jgi:DNA invertase Pin-like site-specific DNA recombinase